MRFCKLVLLDTFSIIQSLSGKPTHPPFYPSVHCLDPEGKALQFTDSPRGGEEKSLASTQRGLHTLRPLLGFVP